MPNQLEELKRKYADAVAGVRSDAIARSLFDDAKKCVKGISYKNTCINASYICRPSSPPKKPPPKILSTQKINLKSRLGKRLFLRLIYAF